MSSNSVSRDAPYQNPSFLPKSMWILSGSALKVFACVIMLIDHSAAYLVGYYDFSKTPVLQLPWSTYSLYMVMRGIGRLAFPIFCFLITEGFAHTRNRLKYGRNLLIFAFLSEIPWNLVHMNLHYSKQNVFFTLFLGVLAMSLAEYFESRPLLQVLSMFAVLFLSTKVNADYSYRGFILLMIFYWLRKQRTAQALIASSWLYYEWAAGFAFIPINMYNGKRGFIQSRPAKYFFYLFYPLHLLIIWMVRKRLLGY